MVVGPRFTEWLLPLWRGKSGTECKERPLGQKSGPRYRDLKRIVNAFVISIIVIVFSMDFLRLSMKNYNGFRTSQLV